jgi:hypothetical protein
MLEPTYETIVTFTTTHGAKFTAILDLKSYRPDDALREIAEQFDQTGRGFFAGQAAGGGVVAVRVPEIVAIELVRK